MSVILSGTPCKDGNVRFRTVPLKALSDELYGLEINVYDFEKFIVFNTVGSLQN